MATKGIYLSPLLLVLKVGTQFLGPPFSSWGDYLVVVFVFLVLFFFTILPLTVLMHFFVGPRSEREAARELQLPAETDFSRGVYELLQRKLRPTVETELSAWVRGENSSPGLRLRGTLRALDEQNDPVVLSDHWWLGESQTLRLFSARSAVLVRPHAAPVILAFEAPCWIANRYRESQSVSAQATCQRLVKDAVQAGKIHRETEAFDAETASATTFRVGDEIEVVGATVRRLDSNEDVARRALERSKEDELDNDGGPYRQEAPPPVLVLVSSPEQPLLLRSLSA